MATNAYSPYAPQVLGDTWVPIVEDPLKLANRFEQGYWFNLSAASTIVTSRIYVAEDAVPLSGNDIPIVSVYPENGLDWGPVKQLTIPTIGVTAYEAADTITPFGASTAVQALYSPNVSSGVIVTSASSTNIGMYLNFDVAAFSTQLTNKRILKVEFLYTIWWEPNLSQSPEPLISVWYGANNGAGAQIDLGFLADNYYSPSSGSLPNPASMEIPLATAFYNTVTSVSSGDRYPFNYPALARFDPSTTLAQRLAIGLLLSSAGVSVSVNDKFYVFYAAMRVTYCNETRELVGGRIATAITPQFGWGPAGTAFSVPLLDPTYTSTPSLPAANYVVTLDNSPPTNMTTPQPGLRALRQLYTQETPGIKGIAIPVTTIPTTASVAEQTDLIPAISLHTSTDTVADSHGYGQQVGAAVYTGSSAKQGIVNSAASGSTSYSMARFFARRFGQTASPLGLRVEGTTSPAAEITVADFDALEEIADGWKQVDLTFSTPLTFATSGSSSMEFYSAAPSGARWEVLTARATNVTGYNFVEVGPNHWLPPTTYGGSTQYATYDQESGTPTADVRADITLMFATMPTMTGLAVEGESLALDYLTECDQLPGAIPTSLDYNALTWTGSSAGVLGDAFTRTEVSGWGNASTGQAWSVAVGTNIYSVNGSAGVATPAVANTPYVITSAYSVANTTNEVTVTPAALAVGAATYVSLIHRYADASNMYAARFSFNTDGTISTRFDKIIAGVTTPMGTLRTPGVTYGPGVAVHLKSRVYGSSLFTKMWRDGEDEPELWHYAFTNTELTAAGNVGMRFLVNTGGTVPITFQVDNFTSDNGFGAYELQREDDYTDWQTIMLATSPTVVSFNDFEARVGVESRYRIRACHELDFCGEWSSEAAITTFSPGVGGDDLTDNVMMFTSNVNQDGSSMLAYEEIFDGTPNESFTLFEASDVTMQPRYNADYRLAFHGTERGGQQFSRTILINNAAITLINYEKTGDALRNLAWASLPYVCIRDGHGSRWFTNIQVPQITIQPPRNTLQMAQLNITEVTATPYPVNP